MQNEDRAPEGRSLVSNRTMEAVIALLLLVGSGIVIYDTTRLGFRWIDGEGPAPGYYPFWVAVILGISSLVNLAGAVRGHGAGEIFVSLRPFGRVLAVLVPSLVYVALIGGLSIGPVEIPALGIYVASAIFIFAFMIAVGRENPLKAIGVAVAAPVALFLMFEKWFLVPLPKGPLEAWLGY
ncbi:MAG TPA: tripartite tricarboxylate transporter TctB family protein [Castellaniella sp.]|nr:tripartite tricarboxylate transporter TctB family protein [Castellaniella sp.]